MYSHWRMTYEDAAGLFTQSATEGGSGSAPRPTTGIAVRRLTTATSDTRPTVKVSIEA